MPTVTIADKVLANAMKPTQKGWTRQALSKDVGEGKAKFVKNALQKLEQEEKIEVTSGEGSGTRWRIIPHARKAIKAHLDKLGMDVDAAPRTAAKVKKTISKVNKVKAASAKKLADEEDAQNEDSPQVEERADDEQHEDEKMDDKPEGEGEEGQANEE